MDPALHVNSLGRHVSGNPHESLSALSIIPLPRGQSHWATCECGMTEQKCEHWVFRHGLEVEVEVEVEIRAVKCLTPVLTMVRLANEIWLAESEIEFRYWCHNYMLLKIILTIIFFFQS